MIRPLATLVLTLSLFSCSTSRSGVRGFDATRPLPAGGLGDRHPADIAVAPVTDQTSTQNAPIVPLREALCVGLVERLYTPLDLDYVAPHTRVTSNVEGFDDTEWDKAGDAVVLGIRAGLSVFF